MTATLTTPESHAAAFAARLARLPGPPELRREAMASFASKGFPGPRDEDWKFTDLRPLLRTPHQFPNALAGQACSGHVRVGGLLVMGLGEAIKKHPDLVLPHLGQVADWRSLPFVALNTAFWKDSLFVHVADGVDAGDSISLSFRSEPGDEGPARLLYRRILVVLGKGARATVQETHLAGDDERTTSNTVCEIVLGEGAHLDHHKLQREPITANHIATTAAVLHSRANFSTHYFGLGGALVRNEVRVRFAGQNAEATVNGLYQIDGTQHHDNHTVIDHAVPHCNSHELYKGVLAGRSRGVFNGKIFVRQDAQKTDAKQTNRTLLLSDDATINTKPQLEIFADDVKCTHGATVGQLDEQQLFYLRSRGIGDAQARALLTFAFANEIVTGVKLPRLRESLEEALLAAHHLPRLDLTGVKS
jgi:Fe-S cluster assembly protein SufD